MRFKKKYTLLCLFAVAGITCKKEKLQPGNLTGQAVFYFNGSINSAPVSIKAGINNYYMYSSYAQDSNNVYNFTGSLHPVNCGNCPNSIQFTINDYKTTAPGGYVTIDSSLVRGNYLYLAPSGGISSSYSVTFTPTIGHGTPQTFSYKFGDGGTYTGSIGTQTHTYTHPGPFTTLLLVHFISNNPDTIQSIANPGSVIAWNTLLYVYNNNPFLRRVTLADSINFSNPPYTLIWNFGDKNMYTETYTPPLDTVAHTYATNGLYKASVTIVDSNNDTNIDFINVVATDTSAYNPNYISTLTTSAPVAIPNPKAFSNVKILYTDGAGDIYSSANVSVQPATSAFQVTSVSSYQNNENNQTTKILHVKFNCALKDASGNAININNGDAVIAVAYK